MIRKNQDLLNYIIKTPDNQFIKKVFNKGEIILEQRKNVQNIFIISSGLAKCYRSEDNGKDFIQEFFSTGEICGEVEVFTNTLSFCSIEAISDMEVYKIRRDQFDQLLQTDQTFNRLIMTALANKISYKSKRHAYQWAHDAESNILNILEANPDLLEMISKQDFANFLGITLRSLNRILHQLKEGGLL
ncbi:Crp/Fnr family transcriptional regulator [Fulvivirga ligni]|uniref:Crp/Fnr family transcriptional regulator n=1 Tax=Fulvivirga ligni TaxID=2904246 RepID=UPI001F29D2B4|nr:Crp/Fnr family transcriptional regulator [Fulvivirga ligni]UII24001.1 Crp/Fnr family transcriptional regulator [Fulvivirga ligni]